MRVSDGVLVEEVAMEREEQHHDREEDELHRYDHYR